MAHSQIILFNHKRAARRIARALLSLAFFLCWTAVGKAQCGVTTFTYYTTYEADYYPGYTIGTITTAQPIAFAGQNLSISGSGWACTPGRTCRYNLNYLGGGGYSSDSFTGSALQPNFTFGPIACETFCAETTATLQLLTLNLDSWQLLARQEIFWPCKVNVPIMLFEPPDGASFDYTCNTPITGHTDSPSTEPSVTINLDGNVSTVSVDANGNFGTNAAIVSGPHTVTASNSVNSDTHQFTSLCKSIDFAVPVGSTAPVILKNYGPAAYPANQTEDSKIQVKATVTKDQQIAVGETVYFRLKTPDPPDSSAYLAGSQPGDNAGSVASVMVTSDQSDGNGVVETTLILPADAKPGDNYQIEASFEDFAQNPNPSYNKITGLYEAWRRVYVEQDKMLVKGGLLKEDATPGSSSVTVYKWATLPACNNSKPPWGKGKQPSPCYQIVLFDSAHSFETNLEKPYVGWTTIDSDGDLELHLVNSAMGNYVIAGLYKSSQYPTFSPISTTSANSGAVGLVSSGFYTTDTGQIPSDYNDAFTEFKDVTNGIGAIPYLPPTFFGGYTAPGGCAGQVAQISGYDFKPMYRFAWIWFSHRGSTNHIWLGGANSSDQLNGTCVTCVKGQKSNPLPQYIGIAQQEQAIAFVFRGGVMAYCPTSTQEATRVQNTNNHEIGHIFGRPHDLLCEWSFDGPRKCSDPATQCANSLNNGCQLNSGKTGWSSIPKFDRFDLVCDATSMRRRPDLQGVQP